MTKIWCLFIQDIFSRSVDGLCAFNVVYVYISCCIYVMFLYYLLQIRESDGHRFNLDLQNLLAYSPTIKLYHHLIKYPCEVLTMMDSVVTEVYAAQIQQPLIACNIKVSESND